VPTWRSAVLLVLFLSWRGRQRLAALIESWWLRLSNLRAEGVQELVLISQINDELTALTFSDGSAPLADLPRALGRVDIPGVRMHYAYPTGLTAEVLAAMADTPDPCFLNLHLPGSIPIQRC
jgi:ribosomal protein S12 methylthiotransferase